MKVLDMVSGIPLNSFYTFMKYSVDITRSLVGVPVSVFILYLILGYVLLRFSLDALCFILMMYF